MFVVLSSNLFFGETWKCNLEPGEEIYSKVELVRVGDHFEFTNKGYGGIDVFELIMENDHQIILYNGEENFSFISILNKEYKTITTFVFDGDHPKHQPNPAFGNCEVLSNSRKS